MRGQALVELAIAAPLLVLLLVGGAQVGAIVYAQVTVDTAAREGARVASQQPNRSGAYAGDVKMATEAAPVVCPSSGVSTNPVCNAVWNASGLLDGHSFVVKMWAEDVPAPAASGTNCPSGSVTDGYIDVSVTYKAAVFVPMVDSFFATGPGYRSVTTTVRNRVEPCTLTAGN